MENAISKSTYLSEDTSNQRPLQIRWNLGKQIDLAIIKTGCPQGYAAFTQSLLVATEAVIIGHNIMTSEKLEINQQNLTSRVG